MADKLLITSGCSFSECISTHIDTWPRHLYRQLNSDGRWQHKSYAMGSQGNGLIARSALYGVVEALKHYKPEDILVGVMWSGSNRHDYRYEHVEELEFIKNDVHNGWIKNPTSFVQNAEDKWVILNVNWSDKEASNYEAQTYYKMFHDIIGHSIYSLEHILRLQLFLQKNNIRYFFTDYCDENIVTDYNSTHEEISYLLNLIDRSHYLPVSSEHRWLYENSKYHHLWDNSWKNGNCLHPINEQHAEFVQEVILPWLKEKQYI